MAMNHAGAAAPPSGSSWVRVAVAWALVGLPLLWGMFNTVKKAMALFR
jgi:hypothetical protein